MAAITALNVSLDMDASNFVDGVVLARAEVNRINSIMRQSVPPSQKFQNELELLNKTFSDTGKQTKEYANAVEFLANKYKQVPQAMREVRAETEKVTQGNSAMMASVKSLAAAYLSFQGAKSFIQIASDMEQATIAFEVMTGSAQAGQKVLGELRQFAASTPITLPGAQQAAKTLLAFGMSAEKVMPTLRHLGDISGGNQEKFQSLALAFAQVQATGRLMGQEVLQMVNAGFNPLQEISRTTGLSMVELKKQMEEGGISAQMVADAFASATGPTGRFFGMMDRMSQTAAGSYAQMISAIQETVAQIGSHLLPILASTAKNIEMVVRTVSTFVSSMSQSEAQLLATVAAFTGAVMILPKVVSGITLVVGAIKMMTKAQITALAFAGPKGWAQIAAGAAAAYVAVNMVNDAYAAMNEEMEKTGDGGKKAEDAANKASTQRPDVKPVISALENDFLKLETSLNEQVKLLNLGEDAYRRQQMYAKGMSIAQVKRIEELHAEIKLAEERNKKQQDYAKERTAQIEKMKKDAEDAFNKNAESALAAARKVFEESRKRDEKMRQDIAKGPHSMELGSAESAKYLADQANAAMADSVIPEKPTPGEAELIAEAQRQFKELQAVKAGQDTQLATLKELLVAQRENGFRRVR